MIIDTTEGNRQDVPAPPALAQPEATLLHQKEMDSSPEMGACVGAPPKDHGDPSCLLPWFREGNSLFLSHPVHQHPRGQGGRGNFVTGVIPRHSLVAVTPCHPTGAVDRGHQGGQPPSSTPERRLVRRHPLAAASKQSHMPLSSSVKGICCLLLAYKSI